MYSLEWAGTQGPARPHFGSGAFQCNGCGLKNMNDCDASKNAKPPVFGRPRCRSEKPGRAAVQHWPPECFRLRWSLNCSASRSMLSFGGVIPSSLCGIASLHAEQVPEIGYISRS